MGLWNFDPIVELLSVWKIVHTKSQANKFKNPFLQNNTGHGIPLQTHRGGIFFVAIGFAWTFVRCSLSVSSCLSFFCFSASFTSSLPHSTCTVPNTSICCSMAMHHPLTPSMQTGIGHVCVDLWNGPLIGGMVVEPSQKLWRPSQSDHLFWPFLGLPLPKNPQKPAISKCVPENFVDRIIFISKFNDIEWTKEIQNSAFPNFEEDENYAKKTLSRTLDIPPPWRRKEMGWNLNYTPEECNASKNQSCVQEHQYFETGILRRKKKERYHTLQCGCFEHGTLFRTIYRNDKTSAGNDQKLADVVDGFLRTMNEGLDTTEVAQKKKTRIHVREGSTLSVSHELFRLCLQGGDDRFRFTDDRSPRNLAGNTSSHLGSSGNTAKPLISAFKSLAPNGIGRDNTNTSPKTTGEFTFRDALSSMYVTPQHLNELDYNSIALMMETDAFCPNTKCPNLPQCTLARSTGRQEKKWREEEINQRRERRWKLRTGSTEQRPMGTERTGRNQEDNWERTAVIPTGDTERTKIKKFGDSENCTGAQNQHQDQILTLGLGNRDCWKHSEWVEGNETIRNETIEKLR